MGVIAARLTRGIIRCHARSSLDQRTTFPTDRIDIAAEKIGIYTSLQQSIETAIDSDDPIASLSGILQDLRRCHLGRTPDQKNTHENALFHFQVCKRVNTRLLKQIRSDVNLIPHIICKW